jgi:hypothetical protein
LLAEASQRTWPGADADRPVPHGRPRSLSA